MAHDPLWIRLLLFAHVAAGTGGLVLAPVALATAKGGKQHKRWGMVYLWCMGVVAGTAIPMAIFRPVLFLAMVAVFSFYAAYSGYRVLKLKDLPRGGKARVIDWTAGIVTFGNSLALALLGWFRPDLMRMPRMVPVVFGLLGMRLAYVELKSFVRKPTEKMFWWFTHLGNFIGSYIAMWSAFSVVTLTQVFGKEWYVWLWPTIVGVPAIVVTSAYYARKFAPKQRLATAA
ncbi:MAG: hypothetical protein ACRYGF_06995 [Janthinobacterium lividum]